jgi:hypothetical protein
LENRNQRTNSWLMRKKRGKNTDKKEENESQETYYKSDMTQGPRNPELLEGTETKKMEMPAFYSKVCLSN